MLHALGLQGLTGTKNLEEYVGSFQNILPCSNLRSAAVAKKTQSQLRDNTMTQKGVSAPLCTPSFRSHHQQSCIIINPWLEAFGSFLSLGSEGKLVSSGLSTIYKINCYPTGLHAACYNEKKCKDYKGNRLSLKHRSINREMILCVIKCGTTKDIQTREC